MLRSSGHTSTAHSSGQSATEMKESRHNKWRLEYRGSLSAPDSDEMVTANLSSLFPPKSAADIIKEAAQYHWIHHLYQGQVGESAWKSLDMRVAKLKEGLERELECQSDEAASARLREDFEASILERRAAIILGIKASNIALSISTKMTKSLLDWARAAATGRVQDAQRWRDSLVLEYPAELVSFFEHETIQHRPYYETLHALSIDWSEAAELSEPPNPLVSMPPDWRASRKLPGWDALSITKEDLKALAQKYEDRSTDKARITAVESAVTAFRVTLEPLTKAKKGKSILGKLFGSKVSPISFEPREDIETYMLWNAPAHEGDSVQGPSSVDTEGVRTHHAAEIRTS